MAALAIEMEQYLGPEQAKSFCREIARKLGLATAMVAFRVGDLRRWSQPDQKQFMEWFGTTSVTARDRILRGLEQLLAYAATLDCSSFLPHSKETIERFGCSMPADSAGVVAAVCPIPGVRKIFLAKGFFELRETSMNFDSQVSTLIHELAHLPEVFGTRGPGEVYFFSKARRLALSSPDDALNNSDNIAGYVVTR